MTVTEIVIQRADPALPSSVALVRAMETEIAALYSDRSGSVHTIGARPDEMTPPDGDFLVIADGDRLLGCGGLKRLDENACEIKRMYVVPEVRGQGLSRLLLDGLEERARELGYRIARLDTADRQPGALPLYEGAGYRRIPPYNDNDLAVYWFEKELR